MKQVVKEFWQKAASHVASSLRIELSLSLRVVIYYWMTSFAAYTAAECPSASQWAEKLTYRTGTARHTISLQGLQPLQQRAMRSTEHGTDNHALRTRGVTRNFCLGGPNSGVWGTEFPQWSPAAREKTTLLSRIKQAMGHPLLGTFVSDLLCEFHRSVCLFLGPRWELGFLYSKCVNYLRQRLVCHSFECQYKWRVRLDQVFFKTWCIWTRCRRVWIECWWCTEAARRSSRCTNERNDDWNRSSRRIAHLHLALLT